MRNNTKLFLGIFITASLCGFIFYFQAGAFNGPTQTPPSGNGTLAAGTSNNMSVGTSMASSSVSLLVTGSTTNSSAYGLEVMNSAGGALLTVRNDGVISAGTSVISGGSFTGAVVAGNISSGQFGSNEAGGNFGFPAAVTISSTLTQVGGVVSLASTTVTGNTTTTKLTVTGITSAPCLQTSGNGTVSAGTCGTGSGTVTTSTATVANDFTYWNSSAGTALVGSSPLSISGTTLTQANAFIVTGSATFKGGIISTSTTMDTVSACAPSPSIVGSNGIGRVTTGATASSTCTVTFGTAFANTPICVVSQQSTVTATTTLEVTPSTSKLVISMSSSTAFKSMVIDYICIGQ